MEKNYEERKQNTLAFFKAYQLHLRLEDGEETEAFGNLKTSGAVVPPDPCDEELAEGQIRVLPGTERITYVALLQKWGDDAYVVAPFSAHRHPATDEEFKPEFDGGCLLHVLQLWNVRTLQNKTLKKSWCSGELPEADRQDALAVWRWMLNGGELEERLLQKTGLPIYHQDDPRLEYKQNELQNFAAVDAADLALLEQYQERQVFSLTNKIHDTLKQGHQVPPLLGKALQGLQAQAPRQALAAGAAPKNITKEFAVEGRDGSLLVTYRPGDSRFVVTVQEGDFDGWEVRTADDVSLGFIEKGKLYVGYDAQTNGLDFVLLDLEGEAVVVKELE